MVVPFLGVYMVQALHFSIKETGLVLSAFGLGAVVGSYLGGWLTDKIGFFKVQAFSFFLTVPLYLVITEFKTVASLSIGVFVLSLVADSFRPANSVALSYFTKKENITKAFSLNRMAINLGFSIGPALGGFLAGISYDWLFYGNAIGTFLAFLLFVYYFRGKGGSTKKRVEKGKSPYREPAMIAFMFLCSLYAICFFQLLSTLPLFYKKVHFLSEIQIGVILGYSGLFIVLFEMLIVDIVGKLLSLSKILIVGTLLCGLAFVMLNFGMGLALLYLSISVLCVSEILAMPYMSTVFVNRSVESNRGAYMGMFSLAFSFAHIFSPYLGTHIIDLFGFEALWWLTGLLSIITAAGFYFLRRIINF